MAISRNVESELKAILEQLGQSLTCFTGAARLQEKRACDPKAAEMIKHQVTNGMNKLLHANNALALLLHREGTVSVTGNGSQLIIPNERN
jgi:hypothetical protein